jgi:hypothetical protein
MPNLGWDPTPGSVPDTQALARRHADVVHELTTISTLLGKIDLGRWQGDASQATEAKVFGTVLPALKTTLDEAGKMAAVSSKWAGLLAGFQHEADLLEQKAKTAAADLQAANQVKTSLPTGVQGPVGTQQTKQDGVDTAAKAVSGIQTDAHDLNTRYLAAAKTLAEGDGGGEAEHKPWQEQVEPFKVIIEGVLAPFDIVAADHWLGLLEKAAGQPSEWLGELDGAINTAAGLQKGGKSASEALIEAANLAEKVGGNLDAFGAFAPGWLQTAARGISGIRGLGVTLTGLGVLADLATIAIPPDKGAMGWVDRGAAGVNGTLLILNASMDEIPVAGEVVMIGTGLYLAGNFLYHHWKPFTNVCNDVGHGTVVAAKWTGHAATTAWNWTSHTASSAWDGTTHVAGKAWHSVTSTIGSWF